MKTIMHVVGARPNFMKAAAVMSATSVALPSARQILVHTGQHFSPMMSDVFFRDLTLPVPDECLGVGAGSHAEQTGKIMVAFEPVLAKHRPDVVVVVGDVNSTVACALTAVKAGARVCHVEAGLRSFDRSMPEEINRVVTDAVADVLFVSEPSGVANLLSEGRSENDIHLVGNVMIDTLKASLASAKERRVHDAFNVGSGRYGVVTLHRPSNVDDRERLLATMSVIAELSEAVPMIFPVHPRTAALLAGLSGRGVGATRVKVCEPLGYVDFLSLVYRAMFVITDSGGLQEETTALGVPCLTFRENTERPITVTEGTNTVIGTDPNALKVWVQEVLSGHYKSGRCPALWDGHAGQRIADVLAVVA